VPTTLKAFRATLLCRLHSSMASAIIKPVEWQSVLTFKKHQERNRRKSSWLISLAFLFCLKYFNTSNELHTNQLEGYQICSQTMASLW
jgi:hypothetical protein